MVFYSRGEIWCFLFLVDSLPHDAQHEDTVLYFQSRAKIGGVSGGALLEGSLPTQQLSTFFFNYLHNWSETGVHVKCTTDVKPTV